MSCNDKLFYKDGVFDDIKEMMCYESYLKLLGTLKGKDNISFFNSCLTNTSYDSICNLWKKPPKFVFGTSIHFKKHLKWIEGKTEMTFNLPEDINEPSNAIKVIDCLEALMKCVGADEIINFEGRDGTAKFKMIGETMSRTQKSLSQWKNTSIHDYKSALSFVSKFAKCVTFWFQDWLHSEIRIISKVVFLRYVIQKYNNELKLLPMTHLFLIILANEAFNHEETIINNQKHLFIDENIGKLLDIIKTYEPSGVRYIAYVRPSKEIFELTPPENIQEICILWQQWMPFIVLVLRDQWDNGIRKSIIQELQCIHITKEVFNTMRCGRCEDCHNTNGDEFYYHRCWRYCKKINMNDYNKLIGKSTCVSHAFTAWHHGVRYMRAVELKRIEKMTIMHILVKESPNVSNGKTIVRSNKKGISNISTFSFLVTNGILQLNQDKKTNRSFWKNHSHFTQSNTSDIKLLCNSESVIQSSITDSKTDSKLESHIEQTGKSELQSNSEIQIDIPNLQKMDDFKENDTRIQSYDVYWNIKVPDMSIKIYDWFMMFFRVFWSK